MELTEFLLARIAEDEDAARKCVFPQHGGAWTHDGDGEVDCAGLLVSHPVWVCQAAHIARHDPDRVLAECEAKRRIVEYRISEGFADDGMVTALRAIASVYADHPDYRPEWV